MQIKGHAKGEQSHGGAPRFTVVEEKEDPVNDITKEFRNAR